MSESATPRLVLVAALWLLVLWLTVEVVLGDDGLDLPVDKPQPASMAPISTGTVWVKVSGTGSVSVAPLGPPAEAKDREAPPTFYGTSLSESSSVFYVLDFSGSMALISVGKRTALDGTLVVMTRRDQAIVECSRSIRSLPASFRFDVMAYDCVAQRWRPGLEPATDPNKAGALDWLNSLPVSYGGTGTAPAVVDALRSGCKLVVLLTDGQPNCPADEWFGVSGDALILNWHRTQIREKNTAGARIDVYGLGAEGSLKTFCKDVASDARGAFVEVK